jgi:hypothetical protein
LVTVTTLIFGLIVFGALVGVFFGIDVVGVVVVVTLGAGGSAVVGVAPLDSARACATLDAVVEVAAPFLDDFLAEEGLAVVAVVVVWVDVVDTRAGSNVLVPGTAPGAAAAGAEEPPPLDPQPATTSETATAAISLGVRDARKG